MWQQNKQPQILVINSSKALKRTKICSGQHWTVINVITGVLDTDLNYSKELNPFVSEDKSPDFPLMMIFYSS